MMRKLMQDPLWMFPAMCGGLYLFICYISDPLRYEMWLRAHRLVIVLTLFSLLLVIRAIRVHHRRMLSALRHALAAHRQHENRTALRRRLRKGDGYIPYS